MTTPQDYELRSVEVIWDDYQAGRTYRTVYGTPHKILVTTNRCWLFTDLNPDGVSLVFGTKILAAP